MTIAIKTADVFTSATLPFFPYESVPGTIMLLEPALSPTLVGVPANNAGIPDLALWLAGSGGTFLSANMSSTTGLIERTSKGGIHAIKTASSVFGKAGIAPNQVVRQYLLDNIGHEFFVSIHGLITRAGSSASEAHFGISFSTTPGTSQLLLAAFHDATFAPSARVSGSKKYPLTSIVSGAPTALYSAAGVAGGYTGTITATAATSEAKVNVFNVGTAGPFNPGNANATSKVFYRAVIEDVTVSGRNFAALSAIDYAVFEKNVLTPGGRYYGDTFTSPSTLA